MEKAMKARVSAVFAVGVFAVFAVLLGADNPASALKLIREKCLKCHSGDKPAGRLRLDTVDNMVRGGKRGPAVVPGKPDDSLIFKAITGAAGFEQMPPFFPLEEAEVATIRRWIYRGAMQHDMGGREP